jgi:formate hydrogenlyase subunit 3/multisubunit Na+/H+ antiporter MnhD subunit
MDWDLGSSGLLYLAAMSIAFGLLAQLLSWRAAPKWLWALVSGVYFGVGLLVSEFWFGWATEVDLQPNIDGLSRDEVLLIGLVPVAVAVVVTRWMARRHARQAADEHEESLAGNRGQPTPHAS